MKYVRFYGSTGSYGTEYEYYESFPDDYTEDEINGDSKNYAYENADSYAYMYHGWGKDWESEDDREWYYDGALEYCGWDYCSKEEYERNCK